MSCVIEARDLKKHFPLGGGLFGGEKAVVHAVDGVNISIEEGKTLGLAGESGCGKTTLGRLLLRLTEPTSGTVRFMGRDLFSLDQNQMKRVRQEMQIIFQDPTASLNPRKTIRSILSRPYILHSGAPREEIESRVVELMEVVGLSPPEMFLDRNPHEFSGGQKQRIAIARAIALRPKFIVADEPVSSLDLSVRAQTLKLMQELQEKFRIAFLLITHDLSVLRSVSHRVAIMYLGKIVEVADVDELYSDPLHPYTKSLFAATPIPNPRRTRARERRLLRGEVPSPIDPPYGCRFHPRCSLEEPICAKEQPELKDVCSKHLVACHMAQ